MPACLHAPSMFMWRAFVTSSNPIPANRPTSRPFNESGTSSYHGHETGTARASLSNRAHHCDRRGGGRVGRAPVPLEQSTQRGNGDPTCGQPPDVADQLAPQLLSRSIGGVLLEADEWERAGRSRDIRPASAGVAIHVATPRLDFGALRDDGLASCAARGIGP